MHDRAPGVSPVSPPGDVVGKVTTGYQGWFACRGDCAPIDLWWHWADQAQDKPCPKNTGIISWPDMRGYETTYASGYPPLGDGREARLFSSCDQQSVDLHMRWMAENGIHTAALQRFNPGGHEGPTRNMVTAKVRLACERAGTKFYIMYDISGWLTMRDEITRDWSEKMEAYTASPAYARQNGKPVVGVWGFGFDVAHLAISVDDFLHVINWFKQRGCYVMGGVPTYWRSGTRDSRSDCGEVYRSLDMLSPWMVGRTGDMEGVDYFYRECVVPDLAECTAHGVDYQPCINPGDLQLQNRRHGDFMWRQFYNHARAGVVSTYISMFDEYNEGNQVMPTAETQADVPQGSGIRSLDEDGTPCSADYYLRLCADGGAMLRGEAPLSETRPTPPIVGRANPPVTGCVALRAGNNGKWVQARPHDKAVVADGGSVGPWERFMFVDLGNDTVALRAESNGQYLSVADACGAKYLVADSPDPGPWQRFRVELVGDGAIALRAQANGRYLCSEGAGLIANRESRGPWETFNLQRL